MPHLRNALTVLALGVAVVTLTAVATSAAEPPQPDRSLARVNVGPISVDWAPTVDYERLVLTIAGPGDLYIRQELKAGQNPWLSLFDKNGQRLPDGMYTYELRTAPRVDRESREMQLPGKLPERPVVQTGYLRIRGGSFVAYDLAPSKAADEPPPTKLRQITANQIISQGLCVGAQCGTGDEGFPLRLKDSFLQIRFEDTPDSFSTNHDWALEVNDLIGPGEYFFLRDFDAATKPFLVEGNAPDSSLYVRSNGNLGLGTATPAQDIHVMSGNTPTIRLEQDGSGGLTARTWDVGANNTSFFVRDVTNSSVLPFQIRSGAPASSIDVAASGNVGIGTASPAVRLDVKTSSNGAVGRVQNTSATGYSGFEYLNNSGNVALYIGTDNASANTRFNSIQNYPIVLLTESVERMRITSAGNVGIGTASPSSKLHVNGGDIRVSGGSFIDDGVTLNAPDYVFEPDYSLMPIEKLRDFVTREKRLPNVPSAREIKGQGLNLSQFQMRLLEKVEELTLYTLTQDERIRAQQEQIAGLLERLSTLEKNLPKSSEQEP
jgi:hypothetical protein